MNRKKFTRPFQGLYIYTSDESSFSDKKYCKYCNPPKCLICILFLSYFYTYRLEIIFYILFYFSFRSLQSVRERIYWQSRQVRLKKTPISLYVFVIIKYEDLHILPCIMMSVSEVFAKSLLTHSAYTVLRGRDPMSVSKVNRCRWILSVLLLCHII